MCQLLKEGDRGTLGNYKRVALFELGRRDLPGVSEKCTRWWAEEMRLIDENQWGLRRTGRRLM